MSQDFASPTTTPSDAAATPADAATLERRLQEALEENARLWEENNRLRAERLEVGYYQHLANQITGSASWKLTTPLRSGKAMAGKVKHKLRSGF